MGRASGRRRFDRQGVWPPVERTRATAGATAQLRAGGAGASGGGVGRAWSLTGLYRDGSAFLNSNFGLGSSFLTLHSSNAPTNPGLNGFQARRISNDACN